MRWSRGCLLLLLGLPARAGSPFLVDDPGTVPPRQATWLNGFQLQHGQRVACSSGLVAGLSPQWEATVQGGGFLADGPERQGYFQAASKWRFWEGRGWGLAAGAQVQRAQGIGTPIATTTYLTGGRMQGPLTAFAQAGTAQEGTLRTTFSGVAMAWQFERGSLGVETLRQQGPGGTGHQSGLAASLTVGTGILMARVARDGAATTWFAGYQVQFSW